MKNCDAYHICLIGELLDCIQKSAERNNKNITYGNLAIISEDIKSIALKFKSDANIDDTIYAYLAKIVDGSKNRPLDEDRQ